MSLRCLIVDDDPGFLEAARALLDQEGVRVVGVASTGTEAVERATLLRPDVTLVDIGLGDENGFDVAQHLLDDPRRGAGEVILISADAHDDVTDLIEQSPAIGILGKVELSAAAIETLLRSAGCERAAGGTAQQ